MSGHRQRVIPLRRMYVAPRLSSFDADYGAYTGHPMDPRYDGPSVCCECEGEGRIVTDTDDNGKPYYEPCEFCGGSGYIEENE